MKKIFWIIMAVMAALLVWCLSVIPDLRDENSRLHDNQSALLSDIERYESENGRQVAAAKVLTMERDEAARECKELCKVIEEMGLKLKRAESATKTVVKTEYEIKTVVKDSIVYVDSSAYQTRAFRWRDAWTDIDGYILNDSANLSIQNKDSLYVVVHRVPKRWWFFKWGTKEIKVNVMNANPHTKVDFVRTMRLK